MKQRLNKSKNLKYLLFVNLFSLIGFYTYAPLYALFASSLGISPKDISFIWSGYSMVMAFSVLIFGKLENTKSKGKLLVMGYFGCAISSALFLMVNNQTSLIIVITINAVAAGMTLPAYKTLFAKNESRGRESEQWSWLDAGTTFSAAAGSAIGGVVIALYGFEGIFIVMAGVQLVAAAVAYKVVYNLQ